MKIFGKAFIVADPEEVNNINFNMDIKEKVIQHEIALIKVKITHADYFENHAAEPIHKSSFKNILIDLYKWVFNQQPDLSPFQRIPSGLKFSEKPVLRNLNFVYDEI